MECGFTLNGFTVNGSLLVLSPPRRIEGLPLFGMEACLRTISALEAEQAPAP